MEKDPVQQFLDQIRREHGEVVAHPMMFVSALHNRKGCYPVKQDDEFFQANGIKFLKLPDLSEIPAETPPLKYVVSMDESGSYRHSVVPIT